MSAPMIGDDDVTDTHMGTVAAVTFDVTSLSKDDDSKIQNDLEAKKALSKRSRLSKSSKAWDLDGDGKLDDAELALKGLDESRTGTLTKEQMYSLMQDNLQTHRDLFKVKQLFFGLAAFTSILALSNFATAFAAAFLAKDTKSSEDKLTDAKTGHTLATQTTQKTFTFDPVFDELQQRHLFRGLYDTTSARFDCRSITHATSAEWAACVNMYTSVSVPATDGMAMIHACNAGKTVSFKMKFSGARSVTHQICPPNSKSTIEMDGESALTIMDGMGPVLSIYPTEKNVYAISGLRSGLNSYCDTDQDCVGTLICSRSSLVCSNNLDLEGSETYKILDSNGGEEEYRYYHPSYGDENECISSPHGVQRRSRGLAGSVASSMWNYGGFRATEPLCLPLQYGVSHIRKSMNGKILYHCTKGWDVSIKRHFSNRRSVTHQICPLPVGSTIVHEARWDDCMLNPNSLAIPNSNGIDVDEHLVDEHRVICLYEAPGFTIIGTNNELIVSIMPNDDVVMDEGCHDQTFIHPNPCNRYESCICEHWAIPSQTYSYDFSPTSTIDGLESHSGDYCDADTDCAGDLICSVVIEYTGGICTQPE